MSEDQNTIQFLKDNNLCNLITWEELQSIDIEKYIDTQNSIYQNEVHNIVSHIFEFAIS